ncbi:MAG: sialate O-acetylesterase [Bacteroidota bacterium]
MKLNLSLILCLLTAFLLKAEVQLPQVFGDNMVLQRDRKVKVWGWADKGEKITISFNGQTLRTKADKVGSWQVEFEAMKASFQPLKMTIKAKNEIVLSNILIGDVWLCGGQSNMEWPISSSNDYEKEVTNAKYPNIRLLDVPHQIEFKPTADIPSTKWKTAEEDNISSFSAVGYFFGRHLHKNHNVPIGLISSNWGGTRAEPWTSAERLTPFEYTAPRLAEMQTEKLTVLEKQQQEEAAVAQWMEDYYPKNDLGIQEKWYANDYDFSDWKELMVPSALEDQPGLEDFDGVVWFKKEFGLSGTLNDKSLFLRLGMINQLESIYINGTKVIENTNSTLWRSYPISKDVFVPDGKNIITIKLLNTSGKGGLVEIAKDRLAISPARWSDTPHDIPLAGLWKYKVSKKLNAPIATEIPTVSRIQPNRYPSSLYNGMIHPLTSFAIKGAIWYQGESNAGNFEESIRYEAVFKNMIENWREKWGYDFPFYFVQLANFSRNQPNCEDPCEQSWAYVRESQTKTLDLPNTGMATIIDVGNPTDIHPRDKQTVGKRLGLIADAQAYGKSVVFSGPMYQSFQVKKGEIWLDFQHTGSGLSAQGKYGYLYGFQIAGTDKVFHWAQARIEGNQVVVFSDKVKQPVAVRYGWENNPEDANLYNKEGLPANPFRTDDWELFKK